MIKYLKITLACIALFLVLSSCDRDLPYEGRTESVVVDITRTEGTNGVINEGQFDGDYKISLKVTEMLGDVSLVDYAQLVCVFTPSANPTIPYGPNAPKTTTAVVAVDDIRDLNSSVAFDLESIYKKLNLGKPQLGEVLHFTTNLYLKNGTFIPGWTSYVDGNGELTELYNNEKFVAWIIDGRAYSYRVRYAVACPLVIEDYIGTLTMTDNSGMADPSYSVTVTKVKEEGPFIHLNIDYFFDEADDELSAEILINKEDYSVTLPKTIFYPKYGSYTNFHVVGSGVVETCDNMIRISGAVAVDQGSFAGNAVWTLKK